MAKLPSKFILYGDTQRAAACEAIQVAKSGMIVTISPRNRTTEQNALIHKWFSEIATQKGDESMLDIKVKCNLTYGRPILVRDDPKWGADFDAAFMSFDYETKIGLIRTLDIPFTRRMNVGQLSEYMDEMSRDAASRGYVLTHPDDLMTPPP